MISFEPGLYVSIKEIDANLFPKPLQSGFSEGKLYRVIGMYNASESSEAFLILSNDQGQMWFISNRHLRVEGVFADRTELSFTPAVPKPLRAATLSMNSH